ncbi:nuclear transport factor 2 family protein [Lactobacillus sp.]|jgi:uncharacterized protein with von Willebrand factor type A (vWA) domain|uniref:nuclear transport factor 2 family protein n=1 Tax=Lactobacillus sp. TaxID=1591 RepID=UPI00345E9C0D|nr:nuclear transport factor 2 family protein [Lactobacillus amylovorus]
MEICICKIDEANASDVRKLAVQSMGRVIQSLDYRQRQKMNNKERIIQEYFYSWINQSDKIIKNCFDEKAFYSECYGPIYRNKEEILAWFNDWNKKGKVFQWNIKRIITKGNISIVEWYFQCRYLNKDSDFDGVSLIEFNDSNKIKSIKEFQSKSEHYYPYNL